ncbi:MAG TPA: DnaJ C-terminal domain-containing protein, partial [Negativicutes bacterium]|nr:DnaJ C-terminal domain-containing protein [Negativicutes bacterium]
MGPLKYIDYYEVLKVPKTASEKEIKQAYRQLARQHHPDLHQGQAKAAAEEKFKLINEAYEVLGDAEKRAKYDRLGRSWKAGDDFNVDPANRGGYTYSYQGPADFDLGSFGFSDFFSSLFGQEFTHSQQGGNKRRTDNKGEDIDAEISLSVDELIHGADRDLRLSAPSSCAACAGQRFTSRGVCQACAGTGVTEETKTVQVKIPARLQPGATLRLRGLGGRGYGAGPAGDLYLSIRVAANDRWQIKGRDLEAELFIYPDQAVLGDKVPVPTPHGQVQLKLQPGLHSGQRLRLRDKGLPNGTGFGDLYLRIRIDTPAQPTEAETELYRKI